MNSQPQFSPGYRLTGGGSNPNESGIYAFEEDGPAKPDLPGNVVVAPDVDRLIDFLAADLVVHSANCVREFGDFHIALSGGSTPVPLYRRLMYDPNYRQIPWRRTHLWLVDERCVDLNDEQSNFKMINEIVVEHADIPPEQVHPIFAMADDAATEYARTLRETLSWREKGQDRLDFVLLGMGADGHTASMFPNTAAARERKKLVGKSEGVPADPPNRVTMTWPLINAARYIAVLVTGENKAEVIERVATGNDTPEALPIKGARPIQGELKWFLDAAAANGGQD